MSNGVIQLYEPIVWDYREQGICGPEFQRRLEALGDVTAVTLYIDSPGGNLKSAWEMYLTIKNHPALFTANVRGEACSSAALVALGCDHVEIHRDAGMMVHYPSSGGTKYQRNEWACLRMASAIARRTRQTQNTVLAWMERETWFDAREAVQFGLADSIDYHSRARSFVSFTGRNRPNARSA